MRRLFAALTIAFMATSMLAVSPIPPYTTWPCDAGAAPGLPSSCSVPDPNDCFSYRSYTVREGLQIRTGDGRSLRSNAKPTAPYGVCSGFFQWCSIAPEIGSVSYEVIVNPDGGRDALFDIPFDFPNNYCQVYDDGPPCNASVFPPKHVIEIPPVRLVLVDAATGLAQHMAPAVFEAGTWKPRISLGCGASNRQFRVLAIAGGGFSGCTARTTEVAVTVEAPEAEPNTCNSDKWCPECNGTAPTAAAGKPIGLGSGDVTISQPLFSIDQPVMPLTFGLTYHSERPVYPRLTDAPLGLGWSHTYSDTLRPVDLRGTILYRHDGEGHETHYEGRPGGPWYLISPAELRGRQSVMLVDGRYVLRDVDGTATAYSGSTGRWQSTTDRWGNSITATYGANGYLTAIRDSVGRELTIDGAGGTINSITLPTGEQWRFEYNGTSLSKIYDPMHTGSTPWRTYEYVPDRKGRERLLSAARDESGALLEGHEYDTQERGITSYSEGGRDMVTVTYLGGGKTKVTTSIDAGLEQVSEYTLRYKGGRWLPTKIVGSCASCGAASEQQTFVLNDANRLVTRTDGSGHVTRYTYDFLGNITSRTEASGTPKARTTTYVYAHPSWRTFVTKIVKSSAVKPGATKTTAFTWSADETVLTRSDSGWLAASDQVPAVHTSTTTYDARHRIVSFDGPRTDVADVATMEYYPDGDPDITRRGRLRARMNAAGHTSTSDDYDIYGTARALRDLNDVAMSVTTDARGRATSATNHAVPGDPNEPTSYTSTTTYDGDRVVRMTDPRGNATRYVYQGGDGRLTDTIRLDSDGHEIERHHLTLNDAGTTAVEEAQLCAVPAPVCSSWVTHRRTAYGYDRHARLWELRHDVPAGAKVVYSYDADGLLSAVQDENHAAPNIRYTYDALDRLITVTETLAGAPGGVAITRYDYDAMGNLTSVVDPNGNLTTYTFDDFGRMTRDESPVTGVTTYAWDPAGNLVSSTDARGAVTQRTYDALGRILSATTVLAAATEKVTYTYDDATPGAYARGRVAAMTDPSGVTVYQYDRRGLLKGEARTVLGDTFTLAYRYDANGNRTGLTYPSGRQITYAYDYADRPRTVSGSLGGVSRTYIADAEYKPFGPVARLVYGDGSLERRAVYDVRQRLSTLSVLANGAPLAEYRYGYDATGNVVAINDALDARYNRSFGYDDLNRLVKSTTGSALWGSAAWTYDPMGNRLTSNVGSVKASFAYAGTTPKLLSVTEREQVRPVTHDAAGNELFVGASAFTYSPRNSLATADGLRYVYDGSGMRVAQVGLAAGPIITEQPRSRSVCPGVAVTLSVRASGATAYRWETSPDGDAWSAVPDGTASTVSVAGTAAFYRVVASNAAASTTSDVAVITATPLATEPASRLLYGDVTRDGLVDSADGALLRAVIAGKAPLPVQLAVADVNGDAQLDALDLALVSAYATSNITCLPQFPLALASGAFQAVTAFAAMVPVDAQAAVNPTQYFFYSPEESLLSHTAIHAGGGAPSLSTDYIWFGGIPVAEESLRDTTTRFTFPDHLGTPFLQTDVSGTPTWRVEYEPFGDVWTARTGTAEAQRLRFPGQEFDEQTPARAYNVFRWYRSAWGRYTQADPADIGGGGLQALNHLYGYARSNPAMYSDRRGLIATKGCTKDEAAFLTAAEKLAEEALTDGKNCLGCTPGVLKDWLKKLKSTTYHCVSKGQEEALKFEGKINSGPTCGFAADMFAKQTGSDVSFTVKGLTEHNENQFHGCGCMQGLLLHEVSHLMGHPDGDDPPGATWLAKKCIPCAQTPHSPVTPPPAKGWKD